MNKHDITFFKGIIWIFMLISLVTCVGIMDTHTNWSLAFLVSFVFNFVSYLHLCMTEVDE